MPPRHTPPIKAPIQPTAEPTYCPTDSRSREKSSSEIWARMVSKTGVRASSMAAAYSGRAAISPTIWDWITGARMTSSSTKITKKPDRTRVVASQRGALTASRRSASGSSR